MPKRLAGVQEPSARDAVMLSTIGREAERRDVLIRADRVSIQEVLGVNSD